MALILNIDVSGKSGLVCLAKDGIIIDYSINDEPMQHAAFLQPAIHALLLKNKIPVKTLDAVAVSNGPGSYTGLRVGLASAKGLCFALQIPLITISTLQVIAKSASLSVQINKEQALENQGVKLQESLFCAMIDARRMEVFFALYNLHNDPLLNPSTAIVDEFFLQEYLENKKVFFSGSGVEKFMLIQKHPNGFYIQDDYIKEAFSQLSYEHFQLSHFANLSYADPFYCKEFYNPSSKILQ